MKESAETIKYYYTGGAVLFTTDINNVKISENILTPGGEVIGSKRFGDVQDGNAWYYFNYDMRGSTTVILKPDGGYKKDYYYDTFGNTTEGGGSFYNETQFTGATYDKSTGMHYLNARYYNPSTGRFLTQDSYTGNPYDPWTQNLYAYCGNNPVNFVDPTGHKAKPLWQQYAETAEKYFKMAKELDVKAIAFGKAADALKKAGFSPMVTSFDKQKSVLKAMVQVYDKLGWAYKKLAANAKDIDDLKNDTEKPVKEALEKNKDALGDQVWISLIYTNVYFYEKVKAGGDWDYKLPKTRQEDKNLNKIADREFIYCDGQVMTWEEFGNFHYGYVGSSIYVFQQTLLWGSEIAHGKEIDYNERLDQEWIKMGFGANRNP